MAVDLLVLQHVLVALALGILIGLEREYAQHKKRTHEFAGIRTFPLIALFGALSAYFGDLYSPWILVSSILVIGALIVAAYMAVNKRSSKYHGTTSEVAALLTFFIGVLSYYGEITFAIILAVLISVILYARSVLHRFADRIKPGELRSTLIFAVIAFVILPLLPNEAYGPYGLFNPYIVWLMVVFISGISFAGYILMKWFGEKGIELSAIFGGLVSSTAVTTSFAARSKRKKSLSHALVLGVLLANAIMFIRILIEVFVLNRVLFWELFLPLSLLFVLSVVIALILWKKSTKSHGGVELGSPFTLAPALKFGVLFALILALVKVANVYLSSGGVYLVSFLSGLADVDAITVSLSQLAGEDLGIELAQQGIMIAALTNVAVKGGIAYFFGSKEFGREVLVLFSVLVIAGLALAFAF